MVGSAGMRELGPDHRSRAVPRQRPSHNRTDGLSPAKIAPLRSRTPPRFGFRRLLLLVLRAARFQIQSKTRQRAKQDQRHRQPRPVKLEVDMRLRDQLRPKNTRMKHKVDGILTRLPQIPANKFSPAFSPTPAPPARCLLPAIRCLLSAIRYLL